MDRLVMITQVIDEGDPVFGATLDWVESCSRLADEFHVIALKVGSHDLPGNVRVHSLGKERGCSRPVLLFNLYRHVLGLIEKADGLFIHQGQIYALLVAPLFRLLGKPVLMWKTHGHVPWTMQLGLPFLNRVLTASEDSFSVDTPKRVVTGHGINTERFRPSSGATTPFSNGPVRMVHTGRVSPTKQIEEMIDLVERASAVRLNLTLDLIGTAVTKKDHRYEEKLRQRTGSGQLLERVNWKGFVPYRDLPRILEEYDLFLNFSMTGSVDKAPLEAMALQRPVLTTNRAFQGIPSLQPYPYFSNSTSPERLLTEIDRWYSMDEHRLRQYQTHARKWVETTHSLEQLIDQIDSCLSSR